MNKKHLVAAIVAVGVMTAGRAPEESKKKFEIKPIATGNMK